MAISDNISHRLGGLAMNTRLVAFSTCFSLALTVSMQSAVAQDSAASAAAIDSRNPPAGYVAPKPDGPRDLSMTTYARESFLDGEEGVVGLRVLVRGDGSVGDAQITDTSGSSRLDQSALNVVKDWRYQPATVNGTPAETWVPVNIVWSLKTLRFQVTRDLGSILYTDELGMLPVGISTIRFLVMPGGRVAKTILERPSGDPRLDDVLLRRIKESWRFRPGRLTIDWKQGGWYRTNILWNGANEQSRDGHDCLEPQDESQSDAIIVACSQFLMKANLTAFQKANAYAMRGFAYRVKHEFDMAITDYDLGIRLYPSETTLFFGRARAHFGKGEKALAFADLDLAVEVEPLSFRPYAVRADFYFDDGQRDRALADADTALRVAKEVDLANAYNKRCHYLIAVGRTQDGIRDCEKSLFRRTQDFITLNYRGYGYLKLGRHQRAVQDYDAALLVNARLAAAFYGRGLAKLKLGDATGDGDISAAKAIQSNIAEEMAKIGLVP